MKTETLADAAWALAEDFLKRTGDAYLTGDADAFADCFALPQKIDTLDGQRILETRQEVVNTFEAVRENYRIEGITLMDRRIVSAEFRDENTMHSTHESRLLRGDILVRDPFLAFTIFRRSEGVWQIAYSQYVITDSAAHNRALTG